MKAKRIILICIMSILSISAVSCSNDKLDEKSCCSPFYAEFSDGPDSDVKTYLDETATLFWTAKDRISIFCNSVNACYEFAGLSGETSNLFLPVLKEGAAATFLHNYAVYPYSENTSVNEPEGVFNVSLPQVQSYSADSFGLGANMMSAVTEDISDRILKFKNDCGYFLIKIYGGGIVSQISLVGNDGERLSGAAVLSHKFNQGPALKMLDSASPEVILDCGMGVETASDKDFATNFWIVVPPSTFKKGITLEITDNLGGITTKSTSKPIVIERNKVQPMSAFFMAPKDPNSCSMLSFSLTDSKSKRYSGWFSADSTTISVTVPKSTDLSNLVATFEHNGHSVWSGGIERKSGVGTMDFSSPVEYIVKSFSGNEKKYSVEVTACDSVRIGITRGNTPSKLPNYQIAVSRAGGIPVQLEEHLKSEAEAEAWMSGLDAVVAIGGYFSGQDNVPGTEDYSAKVVIRKALAKGMPIMGICRGCLDINRQLGGNYKQIGQSKHWGIETQTHHITVTEGSLMHQFLGSTSYYVNSNHSIANDKIADGLTVTALSDDGIVEAYEGDKIIGTQFHPERLITNYNDQGAINIFKHLVKMAEEYRESKQ